MALYLFFSIFALAIASLLILRLMDWRADRTEWLRLANLQPANPMKFEPAMVDELPGPAKRFFNFTIAPGTLLRPVAEIDMGGQFSLGSQEAPNYQAMQARQILAAPHGLVWQMRMSGKLPVSGSDTGSWTRFRLCGLFPVARIGNDPDHALSAYGRCIAEAVFWTPAALLPGADVVWEEVDQDTARVTVTHGALSQSVNVAVNSEGQPITVWFDRWSNANPDKTYRFQPFGGVLSDFREVEGYRLPFRVEAGNMFGTDAYFPFYKADVVRIGFPRTRK